MFLNMYRFTVIPWVEVSAAVLDTRDFHAEPHHTGATPHHEAES